MPINLNTENTAQPLVQGTVEENKRGSQEEGVKKDSSEKNPGKESTGNSSNNPGSISTDATTGVKRHSSGAHTAFDPIQAIKEAMEKVVTTGKEKYPRSMP